MELFTITCTTCKAKLKVRDGAAIGQILGCPKCGSMVHVAAPDGWQPPEPAGDTRPPPVQPNAATATNAGKEKPSRRRHKNENAGEASGGRKPPVGAAGASGAAGAAGASGAFEYGDDGSDAKLNAAWRRNVPDAAGSAPPMAAWIRWSLYAGVPLSGVCLLVLGWIVWGGPRSEPVPPLEPVVEAPREDPSEPGPSAVAEQPGPARVSLDPRWLPSAAEGVLSLCPAGLQRQPQSELLLGRAATLWNPALATWFAAFPFKPADIRRLTWATTDLAAAVGGDDWLAAGLLIVELERPVAERKDWLEGCDTLDWKLGETVCRSVSAADWPHPFAVVGERTIVTGSAAVMRAIAERDGPRTAQTDFDHLVDRLDAGGELLGALDLAAVRADDAMPAWLPLVEMWHAGHDDWGLVRELPKAVGLGLRLDERLRMELLLACDGESSAELVEQALGRVVSALEKTWTAESDGLTKKPRAGEITSAAAGQLKLLISAAREALARREVEREGVIVRLAADWGGDWSAVVLAAIASLERMATINGGETAPDLADESKPIADVDAGPEPPADAAPPAADAVEVRPAVPTRPVRPAAEISARLADTLPAIEFDKVPLADVVRVLSDFSTLEISLDVESLAEMGIKPDAWVTLHLQDVTVEEVLTAALAEFKLIYVVADGHVRITAPSRSTSAGRPR
ncbi:MAG TPA: hypothetical protein VMV69_12010 [Pirellulales bacterium]|nr:hypothetical protein [Pirellulales bacterium]